MNGDPGNLQNLNDIVLPTTVSWWPVAPAWIVLGLMVLLWVIFYSCRVLRRYRANRFRRSALNQLHDLEQRNTPESIAQIPALLKQTALATFERSQVASLAGPEWTQFLAQSSSQRAFTDESGTILERLSYTEEELDLEQCQVLFSNAEAWIKLHKAGNVN